MSRDDPHPFGRHTVIKVPNALIVRMYGAGKTLNEIAAEVDMHPTSVKARLVRAGVKLRPQGRRRKHPAKAVAPPREKPQIIAGCRMPPDTGISSADKARKLAAQRGSEALHRATMRLFERMRAEREARPQ